MADRDDTPDETPETGREAGPETAAPIAVTSRLPLVVTVAVLVLVAAAPLVADAVGFSYLLGTLTRAVILGMAAVALDYVVGYGGLVSLGHAMFLGTGAYTAGILLFQYAEGTGLGTDQALVAWPAAMLVGAVLGWAFGALALRTRGVYFIMVTLAFNQMMFFLFNSLAAYGGDDGVRLSGRNRLGPLSLEDDLVFYYVCVVLLVVVLVVFNRLVRSPSGWLLRAARDNEPRLRSVGARTRRHQLTAFVLSASVASLAGALAVNESQFLSPAISHWTQSGELLVMVIIGGVGSLVGGVLGSFGLLVLEELAIEFTGNWQFFVGLGLIMIVLLARRGLAGLLLGRRRNV